MNTNLCNEMTVILGNENVCRDCSIKVNAVLSQFLNNDKYVENVNAVLNDLIIGRNFNIWTEFPKIISCVLDVNKNTLSIYKQIEKDLIKYVLYGVIFNYLDKNDLLKNPDDIGNLRVVFINSLSLLLFNPRKLKINKQSLFNAFWNCLCGDDGVIKI